jgi:hypothetical protein
MKGSKAVRRTGSIEGGMKEVSLGVIGAERGEGVHSVRTEARVTRQAVSAETPCDRPSQMIS